jgi:hypothetical protein
MSEQIRPTKKQRELLEYVQAFIAQYGYSPSYREIMSGAGYNSVATVAEHVQNLIARGHLRKRDHSARSLEVVTPEQTASANGKTPGADIGASGESWLINKIEERFVNAEANSEPNPQLDDLYVLVGTLSILGVEAAPAYLARLQALKSAQDQTTA